MPKQYFQHLPTLEYQLDEDSATKLVVDILRRIKVRDVVRTDAAIFYNYQMQEGDNPEIIADKYYGSTQYHWVVMLMNNAHHHMYDFVLDDSNFENYINDKYGSVPRSQGVTKTLSDSAEYISASVAPEWFAKDQDQYNNSDIESGTCPAGNTTAIVVETARSVTPFSTIGIGDEIQIFIPEEWYDLTASTATKIPWSQKVTITGMSIRTNVDSQDNKKSYINTNMNSNTYATFDWRDDDMITFQTGINQFRMDVYDATGTVQLANKVQITQAQYVNNTIGTSPNNTKSILSNHDFEIEANESLRNISLLKKEFLVEFIDEFQKLAQGA